MFDKGKRKRSGRQDSYGDVPGLGNAAGPAREPIRRAAPINRDGGPDIDQYMVVWADFRSGQDYDIYGRRLSATGAFVGAEIAKLPSTFIKLEGKQAEQMLKLVDKLEELDDIQNVWANFDISDEEIEKFSKE